jgi:hypothetical protein
MDRKTRGHCPQAKVTGVIEKKDGITQQNRRRKFIGIDGQRQTTLLGKKTGFCVGCVKQDQTNLAMRFLFDKGTEYRG